MKTKKKSVIDEFIALPDSQKERIYQELGAEPFESMLARSRPLNAREREQWRRFKAKSAAGRPRVGEGAKTISHTVERGLLARADAYAQKKGMSRAQLVALGLKRVLGRAA